LLFLSIDVLSESVSARRMMRGPRARPGPVHLGRRRVGAPALRCDCHWHTLSTSTSIHVLRLLTPEDPPRRARAAGGVRADAPATTLFTVLPPLPVRAFRSRPSPFLQVLRRLFRHWPWLRLQVRRFGKAISRKPRPACSSSRFSPSGTFGGCATRPAAAVLAPSTLIGTCRATTTVTVLLQ
jgi:hypothetical protein